MIETKRGNFTLRIICDDGSSKTIHSLYDPEAEARSLVDAFQFDGRGLLVVLGLGLGYHVVELLKRFPDADIVVVEAMSEVYELAKGQGNISEIEDKVKFLVGLAANEVLSEITGIQVKLGMPPLHVFTLSAAVSAFPAYYRPVSEKLKNAISLRLWDRLRYPKFKEDTVKIALIDFSYFLNAEVEKAIKGIGHKVVKITGNKEESAGDILGRMVRMIIDFKPDFILTINHLGFDEEGVLTNFLESINMPVASWYVDSPNVIVKAFDKNVSPYVSIFLWDREYIKDIEAMGFESVTYLPLATDEAVFKPIKLCSRDIKRYRAGVGFVGNSLVESTHERIEKVSECFHPLVERMSQLLSSSRMSLDEAMKTIDEGELRRVKTLSVTERLDLEAAILWKGTLLYRLSCMERLRGFRPRIHGDTGWKRLLESTYDIRPPLHYYKELPLFYNACDINFNATHIQMRQAVNQRVFDVPASGGFLLTDHQKAIGELFEIGKEVITYRDKEEIPELVRFYLDNPEARRGVAERGRERVLREHTYKQRLERIIDSMKERYA